MTPLFLCLDWLDERQPLPLGAGCTKRGVRGLYLPGFLRPATQGFQRCCASPRSCSPIASASTFRARVAQFFVAVMLLVIASLLPPIPARAVEPERLEILTGAGSQVFSVEVMRTDADRAKGLMFRRFMPPDRGMLFDFQHEEPVMMWMRNTIIPLDMVFIAGNGKIVNIAENTEPMSETTVPSNGPVIAVLELNAGTAARLAIKTGDSVRHTMFAR